MKNTLKTLTNLTTAPEYTPEAIKDLIKLMWLNEKSFALLMNVSPLTVKLWLAGVAKPCGVSRRLMQIYETCPAAATRLAKGGDEK